MRGHVTPDELQAIRSAIRDEFTRVYGDRLVKLLLYGSQARGDAKRYSDVDILVVLKGPFRRPDESRRNSEFIANLSLKFDTIVHCFYVDEGRYIERQEPVLQNATSEGIEL